MPYFILTILLAFNFKASADSKPPEFEKIFSCQSQHSLFDPDFVQGSEVYMEVLYYPVLEKFELVDKPAVGSSQILYAKEQNHKGRVDLENSSIYLGWKNDNWKAFVSMVYLGGPWGLATEVPKEFADPNYAGSDYELRCQETAAFEKYFVN